MRVLDNRLVVGLGLIITLLIVGAILSYQNLRQLNESTGWVIHTDNVLNDLGQIRALIDEIETSQRGYIITGESQYLESYNADLAAIGNKIEGLKTSTADNPRQQDNLPILQNVITERVQEIEHVLTLRKESAESARQSILTDAGKKTMDAVHSQIAAMRQEELGLLQKREYQSDHNYNIAVTTGLLTAFLALISVAGFVYLLRRNLRDRILSSAALHEQREWYRTTLTSIGDSVIATDIWANIIFLNAEAEKMIGWTLQEAIKQPLHKIFHIVNEETRQPVDNPVDKVIRDGKIVGLANHTVLIAKDGTERPIADTAAPIRSTIGELVGVILVFHDVSDHRTLEKELKKKADMLMDRDRRKDEFLAMLAHELRNPLAPISNAVPILTSPATSADIRIETGNLMKRQIAQMTRLLNDLLDVSRITQGKIELRRKHISLSEVLQTAIETVSPLVKEHKQNISVNLPELAVWLDGDAIRLSQVFSNLLNNAVKYSHEGNTIIVSVAQDEGLVTIKIKDTGIGIPCDMLGQIFDMFAQVDNSIERTQGGLGIGLTLVKNIIEMHGGAVEARSEGIGKGSEFIVTLPVTIGAVQNNEDIASSTLSASPQSYRILVVDDNDASVKTLGWMLEMLGHQVLLAKEGNEALAKAKSFRPDVVFLDIGLPGMNGYQICKAMRQERMLENAVIIAQSGWGQEEHLQRSKEAGFNQHLVKPIDIHVLEQLLAKVGGFKTER